MSAGPPAKTKAGLIEKETLKSEYRIMNIECRMSKEGILSFYRKD